jgi:CDP-glucose 4,6-dehydratase
MFGSTYAGKKVFVTGHTGFKGAWLTTWLLKLGAKVAGYSLNVPTKPSMFELFDLTGRISHHFGDIRDLAALRAAVEEEQPDFIIHLAAQAIVSRSYADPIETFTTNADGTMNLLEVLRTFEKPCVAVLITSDKCYDNVEWAWGYRETDKLGGKDIYSGSKAAAEMIIRSYVASFFQDGPVRIGVVRAGNVIGGGDWAADRIVVDCVRAWSVGKKVEIRSPRATRPWQHVLEPLSGYLTLGAALEPRAGLDADALGCWKSLQGEAFNFGPRAEQSRTVLELIGDLARRWGHADASGAFAVTGNIPFHEASLLKLNCDKALLELRWEPNLAYEETIRFVGDWYTSFYQRHEDMYAFTNRQIAEYEELAALRRREWAK